MRSISLVFVALVFSSAGCDADRSDELQELFGGAHAVVAKPDKVQAYRLADGSSFNEELKAYIATAGPIVVADDLARESSKLLLGSDSYLWEVAKSCAPTYGVRLEFIQGDKAVDILLCFECDIITVYLDGNFVGGEDFDKIRPQLVKIVKRIFPEDGVIQALKEKD